MRRMPIILLCIILLWTQTAALAETDSTMPELDGIADEALQTAKLQQFDQTKVLLKRFSDAFVTRGREERAMNMDELRVLTVSYNDAYEAVTRADLDVEQAINRVTTFRLVVDALASKYQPLWSQMKTPIMSSFEQVKNAAQEGDQEAYNIRLNQFLSKYSIIQPSLKVDLSVEKLQKLDARIAFIDRYRSDIIQNDNSAELEALESELKALFDEAQEDEADPSLWWVIISTGSIIILTLSYVSWRKYRGEKEDKRKHGQND